MRIISYLAFLGMAKLGGATTENIDIIDIQTVVQSPEECGSGLDCSSETHREIPVEEGVTPGPSQDLSAPRIEETHPFKDD
jgi:hypothetical protein